MAAVLSPSHWRGLRAFSGVDGDIASEGPSRRYFLRAVALGSPMTGTPPRARLLASMSTPS